MNLIRFLKDYRKALAVIFAIIGAGFVVADFGINIISSYMVHDTSSNVFFMFVNFAIMCLVCYHLLNGNLTNSYSAFRGMMMFIFLITFDFAEMAFLDLPFIFESFLAFDPISILLFLFTVGAVVVGIFAYIKTRQYIFMRRGNYKTVFIFALLFTICSVFASGFSFFMPLILSIETGGLMINYAALGDVFLALSVFFTITRLSPRYN